MTGTVKMINGAKMYGFISTEKVDYFFHRDDFDGPWNDLDTDFRKGRKIELEFEPTRTDKGLRATEVRRVES